MSDREVTLRRTVEQVKHCVEEALSVLERGEDVRCAEDDLLQAHELIGLVREKILAAKKRQAEGLPRWVEAKR